jgi:hypothetical protein
MKSSVVFRNKLLGSTGFGEVFPSGFYIALYTGIAPTTPESAATGTLLGIISLSGGGSGLIVDAPANGAVLKPAAAVWTCLTLEAGGVIGYGRLCKVGDAYATADATKDRIDFTIGVSGSGADMTVKSTTYAAGEAFQISNFAYSLI